MQSTGSEEWCNMQGPGPGHMRRPIFTQFDAYITVIAFMAHLGLHPSSQIGKICPQHSAKQNY